MTTAIVVASKHGCTTDIGRRLAELLGPDAQVHDLADGTPDLGDADTVVLGTPVYGGQPHKAMRAYAGSADLTGRHVALFVVGMLPGQEHRDQALTHAYPAGLRERALAVAHLGGRFRFAELNAFERFMVQWVANTKKDVDSVDDDAIARFADAVRTADRRHHP